MNGTQLNAEWVWQADPNNFFRNVKGSKIWTEYNQNEPYTDYRLYNMTETEVVLENIESVYYLIIYRDEDYLIFVNGNLNDPESSRSKIRGSWTILATFPDSKSNG